MNLKRFVIPICTVKNQNTMHVGTGFFVRMPDGAVFLVSAAHVLDKPVFEKTGLFYFATDPKTGLLSARLVTGTIRSPAPPGGQDPKRGHVRRRRRSGAGTIRHRTRASELTSCPSNGSHRTPYPERARLTRSSASRAQSSGKPAGRRVAPMICGLDTLPLPESSYERLGFSPRHNLLLHCDKEKLTNSGATTRGCWIIRTACRVVQFSDRTRPGRQSWR